MAAWSERMLGTRWDWDWDVSGNVRYDGSLQRGGLGERRLNLKIKKKKKLWRRELACTVNVHSVSAMLLAMVEMQGCPGPTSVPSKDSEHDPARRNVFL